MKKLFLGCFLSVFFVILLFSSDFSIIELSTDYYPDVYFTVKTGSELDREILYIKDNFTEVQDFSVIEEKKQESNVIDIILVTELIQDNPTKNFDKIIKQEIISYIKEFLSIHDSIRVKVIIKKDGSYIELNKEFLNDFEAINDSLNYELLTEDSFYLFLNKYDDLKDISNNAFERDNHYKFLLYESERKHNYSGFLAYETQLRDEMMKDISIGNFNFYMISDVFMGDYSIPTRNEIYKVILENAFEYHNEYKFRYENPLDYFVYPKHSVSIFQGEKQVFGFEYTVDLYNQEVFLFDVFCHDYPKIEFSYYHPSKKKKDNEYILYENLNKNNTLMTVNAKKREYDLVLVLESSPYSQYYNLYFIEQIEALVNRLNSEGYSVRLGLITYGSSVGKVFDLNWNITNSFQQTKNRFYGGEQYAFENVVEALMKATEMNYMSKSSKNILFVQSAPLNFDNQQRPDFNLNLLINKLAKNKINFFAFTNNNLFYDLSLRVSGKTFSVDSDIAKLYDYFTNSQVFGVITKHADLLKLNKLLLIESGMGAVQTLYQLHSGDIKSQLAINSITANPFIAKRGEVITLLCSTFPIEGVDIIWEDHVGNNFKEGNEGAEVKWVTPLVKGSYTIEVQVRFENYSLEGKVVVMVQ